MFKEKYDSFNFFASQLRIRIEMAFGMMRMKWGILSRAVGASLGHVKYLITAIAQLHNFCINERLLEAESQGRVSLPVQHSDNALGIYEHALREQAASIEAVSDEFPGWSLNRERMATRIEKWALLVQQAIK